jgi:hypothetical protein
MNPGVQGVPPWHLWGSDATATLISTGAPSDNSSTVQLARVNYKRPETWTFLLYASVIAAPGAVAGPWDFRVQFTLSIGVGRAVAVLPLAPFVYSSANVALVLSTGIPDFRFASQIQLNPLSDLVGTQPNNGFGTFQNFPAQDIQCNAKGFFTGGAAVNSVTFQAGAFFAPRTHVRPDWFSGDQQQFTGERGGK